MLLPRVSRAEPIQEAKGIVCVHTDLPMADSGLQIEGLKPYWLIEPEFKSFSESWFVCKSSQSSLLKSDSLFRQQFISPRYRCGPYSIFFFMSHWRYLSPVGAWQRCVPKTKGVPAFLYLQRPKSHSARLLSMAPGGRSL